MTTEEANSLGPGDRLRVFPDGLTRHGLPAKPDAGTYVSQFESPVHGRLVVVRLDDGGAYGFRTDELERLQ